MKSSHRKREPKPLKQKAEVDESESGEETPESGLVDPQASQRLAEINARLSQEFRAQFPNALRIPFDERMAVISNPQDDDLSMERAQQLAISADVFKEVRLYQNALENAKRAIKQLEKTHKRLFRPADFFAEMFKTEAQMKAVQRRLEGERARLEKLEAKKEKAIQKRFHKQNRHNKNLEASKEKRRNLEAISKWKQSMRKGENKKLGEFYKQGKAADRGALGGAFAPKGGRGKKIGKKGGKGGARKGGAGKGGKKGRK